MAKSNYILRPVSPPFIAFSLVASLLLNLLPWGNWFWVPDFVAMTLVFWNVHHPRKVGIGVAFVMGVMMDVHDATLLGQHALAYTLLSYGAIMMHRRILWFPLTTQAIHILPLFVTAQVTTVIVRVVVSGTFPGWTPFVESFIAALLWPVTTWVLMAPQRRPLDRDVNRPI